MTALPVAATSLDPLHVQMHQNVHDIRAYGAACNGSTDDTAAIQAAQDQVESEGGGTVYFPAATIKHASTLTITGPYAWWRGEGWRTELRFTGSGNAVTVGGGHAGTASSYGGFSDIMFNAYTGSSCTSQIYCDMARYYRFNNVRFYSEIAGSWTQGALRFVGYSGEELGCWSNKIENCVFSGSLATTAIHAWLGWYSNATHLRENTFDTHAAGIRLEYGDNVVIEGNDFSNTVANGKAIRVSSSAANGVIYGLKVSGNRFESHATGTRFLSVDESLGGSQFGSIHLHGNETYNNLNTENTVVLNNPNAGYRKMRMLSEGNWNTGIANGTAVHKLYTAQDVAYVLANTGEQANGAVPTQVDTNGGAGVATVVGFPA